MNVCMWIVFDNDVCVIGIVFMKMFVFDIEYCWFGV